MANDKVLTRNGVMELYSLSTRGPFTLQVVVSISADNFIVARLSDGKFVTPVLMLSKSKKYDMERTVLVGCIIRVKKRRLIHPGSKKCYLLDHTPLVLEIDEFEIQKKSDVLIGTVNEKNDYWECLHRLTPHLSSFNTNGNLLKIIQRGFNRMPLLETGADESRERGNELFRDQRFKEAIDCYKAAASKKVFDDRIYANLALAHLQMNMLTESLNYAHLAVICNPFNIKGYYRACQCLEKMRANWEMFLIVRACKVVMNGLMSDLSKYADVLAEFSIAEVQMSKSSASLNENFNSSEKPNVSKAENSEVLKKSRGRISASACRSGVDLTTVNKRSTSVFADYESAFVTKEENLKHTSIRDESVRPRNSLANDRPASASSLTSSSSVDPMTSRAHHLFVSGLPSFYTESQLFATFSQFGQVVRVQIRKRDSLPGIGYVVFANICDRNAVLKHVAKEPLTFRDSVFQVIPIDKKYMRSPFGRVFADNPTSIPESSDNHISIKNENSGVLQQLIDTESLSKYINNLPIVSDKKSILSENLSAQAKSISETDTMASKEPAASDIQSFRNADIELDYYPIAMNERITKPTHNFDCISEICDAAASSYRKLSGSKQASRTIWKMNSPEKKTQCAPSFIDVFGEECSICFENMVEESGLLKLECNHFFHRNCIKQWLGENRQCPLCRRMAISDEDFPALKSVP